MKPFAARPVFQWESPQTSTSKESWSSIPPHHKRQAWRCSLSWISNKNWRKRRWNCRNCKLKEKSGKDRKPFAPFRVNHKQQSDRYRSKWKEPLSVDNTTRTRKEIITFSIMNKATLITILSTRRKNLPWTCRNSSTKSKKHSKRIDNIDSYRKI